MVNIKSVNELVGILKVGQFIKINTNLNKGKIKNI